MTAARGAGGRLGSRLCAVAVAGVAGHAGRDLDLGVLAFERILEIDLHIVAKIGAPVATAALASASAHELSEQVLEDVGHGTGEIRAEPLAAAESALLEGGMAELVIGRPALRILQGLIGLVDFLELGFCRRIAAELVSG